MIDQGYTNVRVVEGGGQAMEKIFDHYADGKMISPLRGTKTKMRY
jgi:hypothetical protein